MNEDRPDVMLTEDDVCGYCGAKEGLADSKPAQDLGVFRGVRVLYCVDRGACQERVRMTTPIREIFCDDHGLSYCEECLW